MPFQGFVTKLEATGLNQVLELSQLNEKLKKWMIESGVKEIKPSTSTHLRRKLKTEFGDVLHMIPNESSKVLVYPDSLTREQVVLLYCRLQKEVSL